MHWSPDTPKLPKVHIKLIHWGIQALISPEVSAEILPQLCHMTIFYFWKRVQCYGLGCKTEA